MPELDNIEKYDDRQKLVSWGYGAIEQSAVTGEYFMNAQNTSGLQYAIIVISDCDLPFRCIDRVKCDVWLHYPDGSHDLTRIAGTFTFIADSQMKLVNVAANQDGSWKEIYDTAYFQTDELYITLNRSAATGLRTIADCYDPETGAAIPGTCWPEVVNISIDYRQWVITSIFATEEIARLNALSDLTEPYPKIVWSLDKGSIKTGYDLAELSDLTEPYPYVTWRRTPDERDYIFHRLLPNHLPPAPIPYTPLERENVIRVYDKSEPQNGFTSNGLAVLHPSKCISLHNDDRWDIELTHSLDNFGKWKYLLVMNILKIDGQLFRIKNQKAYIDSSGMYISVKASHITGDLADEAVVDSEFTGGSASDFIIWAKSHILQNADESDRYELPYQFNISSDSSEQLSSEKYPPSTLLGLLIGVDNSLINKVHGELFRDNFHLSINRRMEGAKDNAFYLRYSLDMVEISQEVDYSDFCTYLYCYNNWGSMWAVSYAGSITWAVHHQVKKVVKFTYPDYEGNLERLMADGQALTEKCFYPRVTYKMKIAALKNDPKYKDFLELQNYKYGDSGTIYCPELDISTEQKIVEVEKDELTGEIISMTLGNLRHSVVRPTYMGSTISSGSSVSDKVSDSMQSVLIGSNIANMQKYSLQKLQTYPIITLQGG